MRFIMKFRKAEYAIEGYDSNWLTVNGGGARGKVCTYGLRRYFALGRIDPERGIEVRFTKSRPRHGQAYNLVKTRRRAWYGTYHEQQVMLDTDAASSFPSSPLMTDAQRILTRMYRNGYRYVSVFV